MSTAKETIIRLDKSQSLPFHVKKQESKLKNPPVLLYWANMLIALLLMLGSSIAAYCGSQLDLSLVLLTLPCVYIEYVIIFFFARVWAHRWKADKKFYTDGRWPKLLWIFSHNLVKIIVLIN